MRAGGRCRDSGALCRGRAGVEPYWPWATVSDRYGFRVVPPAWVAKTVPSHCRTTVTTFPVTSVTRSRSASSKSTSPRLMAAPEVTVMATSDSDAVVAPDRLVCPVVTAAFSVTTLTSPSDGTAVGDGDLVISRQERLPVDQRTAV